MLRQGFERLGDDPGLWATTWRTIRLAVESTAIALVLGLPLAYLVGSGTSRLRRIGLVVANAGLGLPPVAVGVYLFLLLPAGPLLGVQWVGTLNGMVLGQSVLALPIVVALCATAIRSLPDGLLDQARAFGASGWRLAAFALREARIGVVAAVIVALGSATAEVGAVTIIGGNAPGVTSTLASQVLLDVTGPVGTPAAVAHVIVLLSLMLVLGGILTLVQQSGARPRWRRGRPPAPSSPAAG